MSQAFIFEQHGPYCQHIFPVLECTWEKKQFAQILPECLYSVIPRDHELSSLHKSVPRLHKSLQLHTLDNPVQPHPAGP